MLICHNRIRQVEHNRTIVLLGLLYVCVQASAHSGPPFRIITNQNVGPWTISVWAHADVGTSPFFVTVTPPAGRIIPPDLKVELALQPANGRLPEVRYAALRDARQDSAEYKCDVTLDVKEQWRLRVLLKSSQGISETEATVEATQHGFGRWDLVLYLLPFLGIVFLWLIAMIRRRNIGEHKTTAAISD